MATLLGSATLSTAFTVNANRVDLQTFALDKVSETEFRSPVSCYRDLGVAIDNTAALYNDAVEDYFTSSYTTTGYLTETEGFVEFAETGLNNDPAEQTLYCHFDLLDIDPAATINSITAEVIVESSVGSGSNFGTVQANWHDAGPDDGSPATSSSSTIPSSSQETITLTMSPSSLGTLPTLALVFTGNSTAPNQPPGNNLDIKIYNVRIKVNYTGRTRLTTGYVEFGGASQPYASATSSKVEGASGIEWQNYAAPGDPFDTRIRNNNDLGFSSLLPSDAVVDGTSVLYGLIDWFDPDGVPGYLGAGTGENARRFRRASSATINTIQLKHGTGSTHDLISSQKVDDTTNSKVYLLPTTTDTEPQRYYAWDTSNDLGATRAQVVSENFGVVHTPGAFTSTTLATNNTQQNTLDVGGISPDIIKYAINVAYNPAYISGDVPFDVVTTVTATPVMTHGNTADEIDDFTTAVSVSALGGFLLQATAAIPTAITTTVGTAGRTRTGFTVSMSASFSVPDITTDFAITATSFIFPSAAVTCDAGVTFTTPAQSQSAFTTTPGTTIGRIRTGFTIAVPSAFTTPALTDVLIIKAPNAKQIYTTPQDTRTYLIPEDDRTLTLAEENRTYRIPEDDRTHELEQETRITTPEALQ